MKLIDANDLFKRTCNTPLYDNRDEDIFLNLILDSKEIDTVHAVGTIQKWGECKEFSDIMKPDEFCSRGVIKDDKTY